MWLRESLFLLIVFLVGQVEVVACVYAPLFIPVPLELDAFKVLQCLLVLAPFSDREGSSRSRALKH